MSVFHTAAVWCVPALRVPLVHSLINHFRQISKVLHTKTRTREDPDISLNVEAARVSGASMLCTLLSAWELGAVWKQESHSVRCDLCGWGRRCGASLLDVAARWPLRAAIKCERVNAL